MATDKLDIKVDGLPELEAGLLALEAQVASRVLRRGLREGAKPVVEAAKSNVPVFSGALRESIGVRTAKGRRGKNAAVAFIGSIAKDKKAIALANDQRNTRVKGIFWGHIVELGYGRQAPQPFLRPAFDAKAIEAVSIFALTIKKSLERIARKVNRIAARAAKP